MDDYRRPGARVRAWAHSPAALRWQPSLTILAAMLLAVESLVFVGVHVRYREAAATILSGVLGLFMAFVAYGRIILHPTF